jgi:hypothetical protein
VGHLQRGRHAPGPSPDAGSTGTGRVTTERIGVRGAGRPEESERRPHHGQPNCESAVASRFETRETPDDGDIPGHPSVRSDGTARVDLEENDDGGLESEVLHGDLEGR